MKKGNNRRDTLRGLLRHLRPHLFSLILSLLCAVGTVALTLYVPLLFGRAIDEMVYGETDFKALAALFTETLVLVGITAVLRWCMDFINRRITYLVVRDMRTRAFSHVQRVPLSYLDTHPTGDTVGRIITDTDTVAEGLLLGFSQLFTGVLTILGTLALMIAVRWEIALLVFVLTPMSLLIARFIAMRTHTMFREQAKTQGEQTACIDELIGQLKTVTAFGHEDEACEAFSEVNERLGRISLKAIFFSSLVNPTTRFVNSVIYAVVALVGALIAVRDASAALPFTVGSLSCLLSYVNQYTKPFNEISGVIAELQNALTAADRVFTLCDEPTECDAPDATPLPLPAAGEITLSDVSFSYSADKPLIEQLSLSVKPGEHIAIVGPTGCGKTTLINLLMRFYDVKDGEIRMDGRDVRSLTRSSVRAAYGMVLQDTRLTHASVLDNLRYGRPEASEEEVVAAAKAVHAHGFITRLPQGYHTVLAEGGEGLSAGQKQLLCIARTMLCRPELLILDEATSSIDTRTEMHIQEAFDLMMKGHTAFLVAHRLSTVMNADCILVMRDGHIVEMGTHEALMEQHGFYYELYESRLAGADTQENA